MKIKPLTNDKLALAYKDFINAQSLTFRVRYWLAGALLQASRMCDPRDSI
jgi:hypothetical protein